MARYRDGSAPVALRRSPRPIVDTARPSRRAISPTLQCPRRTAISSRSAIDRYRPDGSLNSTVGMPPPSPNQRFPAALDTPAAVAASRVLSPVAI